MSQIPLRFGNADQFARAREAMIRAGFHEAGFPDAQSGDDTSERFEPYGPTNHVPEGMSAAELYEGLFLRGASCSREQFLAASGEAALEDFLTLGMLQREPEDRIGSTVRVRPMFGLYVVSDHWNRGEKIGLADDIVYPPDIGNTAKYLSFVPASPCQRFLEACGGSGVAALVAASRFAGHAASYDITERSTRFAEFSGLLNGLSNFSVGCGDTYVPAEDQTFDRIVAHPPYVPVLEHTWIYHAGGVDGEAITRKLVEGLPRHLEPGGRFLCRCVGTDRDGQPFEQRIRSWLGDAESDFDVALLAIEAINPIYYVTVSVLRGRSTQADLARWHRAFTEAKILRFVSCFFTVQRRKGGRPVFTVRRDQGPNTGPREFEWLIQWETQRQSEDVVPRLLNSLLRAGPVTLRSQHEVADGKWNLAEQVLNLAYPFRVSWPVEAWSSYLIPRADGSRTGADLHRLLVEEEIIHPEVTPEEFAGALGELVSGGYLILDGFAPPGAA